MDSHTCSLSHVASFLEQNDGVRIPEESPAEAALACQPRIASVRFNEAVAPERCGHLSL